MKCPTCNRDLPAEALFCPECGTAIGDADASASENETAHPSDPDSATTHETESDRVDDETSADASATSPTPDDAPDPESNPTTPKPSLADRFKALDKKARFGIIGGAVAIVAIVCVAVGASLFGGVPTDAAKAAFLQSSLATNGAVSSDYTNETPYEVTAFRIDEESDALTDADQLALARTWYGTDEVRAVTCSGTIANESFETDFSAQVCLAKIDNDWMPVGTPDIISTETKPLKGVDVIDSPSADIVAYTDFSSTLDEQDGIYTSSASGTQTYAFWFGTDTATVQQDFTFDPASGWEPANDASRADEQTDWSLDGMTFEYSKDGGFGHQDGTITFEAVSSESANASYSLSFKADNNGFVTYQDAAVKGISTGTVSHEFGTESFEIALEDSANSVSLTCTYNGSFDSSADDIILRVTADTEAVVYRSGFGYEAYLTLASAAFTQRLDASA